MALVDLNEDELELVGHCLRGAVDGPFFPDWEFQTLMGFSRNAVQSAAAKWPSQEPEGETTDIVIGVLNNLLGYPHGKDAAWRAFINAEPAAISMVLKKVMAPAESKI